MSAVVKLLSQREAERLTDQIKFTIESIDNGLFKLRNLLEEAQSSNVWSMLGFSSWTAYLSSLFEGRPMRLAREERQELVGYLSGEGMSSRAIAPIVGVDRKTIDRDLAGGANVPPASGSGGGARLPDKGVTGRVEDPQSPLSVTGLDGKTYARPADVTVRRSPLIDQFDRAVVDLNRLMDRFARLAADDRLPQNKQQVASMHEGDLSRAVSELQTLLTAISPRKEKES